MTISATFPNKSERIFKKMAKVSLSEAEELFLSQLPSEEFDLEKVISLTKLASARANVLLIGLVLKKQIKEYPV